MSGPQVELLVATHLAVCVLSAMTAALWVMYVQYPRTLKRRETAMREGTDRHEGLKIAGVVLGVLALVGVGVSDAFYNAQHHSDQSAIKAKADAKSVTVQFKAYRKCVNDYSRAMHTYQVANRKATTVLQDAQANADQKNSVLWRLVTHSLATGEHVPKEDALNALGQYNAAAAAATRAKHRLDVVRAANPVPQPPAVACPTPKPKPTETDQ
jgi:hypothetical protein